MSSVLSEIAAATAARRTFAIISHPDAGKTTLTEKLLLYSGMVRTAGMVRARKGGKSTASDWMAMEQERGISITASAMQFPYKASVINLLDTPGHQDFSEDTYRTLTAADAAVMVIDAAKGVEAQTKKLFAVCRMRNIPILTFVNKMDLPARDPFELLEEVEKVLGIRSAPMNWPIGSGKGFVGVIDCRSKEVNLFERSAVGGAQRATMVTVPLDELAKRSDVDSELVKKAQEDMFLLEEAGNPFTVESFLAGEISPVFFGSAFTNFGVEPFFDSFVSLAPSPRPLVATGPAGESLVIDPINEPFSAFVFKIQANMNPRHRDSMAFMRICSGRFERDMTVLHHRLEKEMRLSRSYSMVAQDRNTVDYGYPGDVVGVINPGAFLIGDTLSLSGIGPGGKYRYAMMPRFAPEVLAQIRPKDVLRKKSFDKGVKQLSDEGAIQLLRPFDQPEGTPLVAAVGRLQFDVLQYRLQDEYNVETHLEALPYTLSNWLIGDPRTLRRPQGSGLAIDNDGRVVVLFTSEWERRFTLERNPEHQLIDFSK
jgi:peptide chain release factor 3